MALYPLTEHVSGNECNISRHPTSAYGYEYDSPKMSLYFFQGSRCIVYTSVSDKYLSDRNIGDTYRHF